MALSDEDLRNLAAGIRLEQCVKPRNVLDRVLDRVIWGEPFTLLETARDSLGTLPIPGAYHLRVNANRRLRWMALLFGDSSLPGESAEAGRLYREARRLNREQGRLIIFREECQQPKLLSPNGDSPLVMTYGADFLEMSGPDLQVHVLAAHEIVEGPYGLAILAGRVRKGLPVGLQLIGVR